MKVGHLQKVQYKHYYRPQDYIEQPIYTSMSQKKDQNERYWRIRGSLREEACDHNQDKCNDPSLKWVDQKYEGGVIKDKQKEKLIKELQSCEGNFDTHVDGQARLEERENHIFCKAFKGLNVTTKNIQTIKEQRIKDMV